MQARSLGLQEAAGNLLEKAYAALRDGDDERWRRYARKAAALPWDEHEDVHPAAMEVHMVLFNEVTDAAERADDESWLTAAGESLTALDDDAAASLRAVLSTIQEDYRLSHREARLIRDMVAGRVADNDDLRFGLTPASSADDVLAVLEPMMRALVTYTRLLDRSA